MNASTNTAWIHHDHRCQSTSALGLIPFTMPANAHPTGDHFSNDGIVWAMRNPSIR